MSTRAVSRRTLLQSGGATLAGLVGLNLFDVDPIYANGDGFGYGPLKTDPDGIFDLPRGFRYTVFSRTGDQMDDGLRVPGAHDGMAAFSGPRGLTILVRNHELNPKQIELSSHGGDPKLMKRYPRDAYYDFGRGKEPSLGGTTTILYNTRRQNLVRQFTSLVGTTRNCAGGRTPWQSWLTCEETVDRAGDLIEQDHGYIFEVPVTARPQLARPVPYKAMGRFNHEAIAVDPRTGIVYLTEDRDDGLIYRYLPDRLGRLGQGGRLQALKLMQSYGTSTRNWPDEGPFPVRRPLSVQWVDIENVEAPEDDL